ncbi:MAG: glycosyltransferase family 4 protein [Clostridia bacterium]|nr:glycosyltransferase family 4 protein [Clostridia bacterium]
MKVLLISPLPPPAGGIASWTKRYLASETAMANEVDIVNIAVMGKRAENFTGKKTILEEAKRLLSFVRELKKKLKEKQFDIVHLNSSCSKTGLIRDVIAAFIVKKSRTKLLVHFRCDVTYMLRSKLSVMLFRWLVKISDCVLTLNTVSHKFISEHCKKESMVVSNFISDEFEKELAQKKEIKEKAENFLFVGHVTEAKGCDLICKLAEKFPQKTFTLVGVISESIQNMNRAENVIFKGELPLSQVKQEYLLADAFLFPTHTEGFPNVVAEAMACGMPIITTPVGAIPDMLEKDGGIILPVGDEEAFVKAIEEIDSPSLRQSMSEFNQSKVESCYTIKKVMERLFEIYKSC